MSRAGLQVLVCSNRNLFGFTCAA